MNPALLACLHAAPQARTVDSVAEWRSAWQSPGPGTRDPVASAIAGGFAADRVAWAFTSGYQAALRALVPSLPSGALAAFCVTEAEGNRPRHVRTTITPQPDGSLRIDGCKRWATLGPVAAELLIVGALAGAGDAARPALRVARVVLPAPGLQVTGMPATPFVPEVPHAGLQLNNLRVSAAALLPGDGYDAYVKPFRTLEDLHVTLAVLAYLLREARARRWPTPFIEPLVAALVLLAALAAEDPLAAGTHVALAGALQLAHQLYAQAQPLWQADATDPAAIRWLRDTGLFGIAAAARRQRAERAWAQLGIGPAAPG
jgi:hypothetical protein